MGNVEQRNPFNVEYVKRLPADPVEAALAITSTALNGVSTGSTKLDEILVHSLRPPPEFLDNTLLPAAILLEQLRQRSKGLVQWQSYELTTADRGGLTKGLVDGLVRLRKSLLTLIAGRNLQEKVSVSRSYYAALLDGRSEPVLLASDVERIQELVHILRTEIRQTNELDERHKARILKRVDALQAELDQPLTALDRGMIRVIELGAALGEFGKKVKPLVDRVREVGEVFGRSKVRSMGLPEANRPELLPPEEPALPAPGLDPQETGEGLGASN